MSDVIKYVKNIVLYLDLLGFANQAEDPKNVETIHKLLNVFKSNESDGAAVEITFSSKGGIKKLNPIIHAFSDHIIISRSIEDLPEKISLSECMQMFFQGIAIFASIAIDHGFLFRGGLTINDLYNKGDIIFGPGLNEAYKLESKAAIFPRVILSTNIVNHNEFTLLNEYLILDRDGKYYVDYLDLIFTGIGLEKIEKFKLIAAENINKFQNCGRGEIVEKWEWFKQYLNEKLNKYNIPSLG